MTNQFKYKFKYNSIVLNAMLLGVTTAIATALFLPVGQGAFFGTALLCLIMSSALYLSLFMKLEPSSKIKIRPGEIITMLIIFLVTSLFIYLSGMEILHWNIPYSEYRHILHQDEGYVWTMSEYEKQIRDLFFFAMMFSILGMSILSMFLGIAVFGKKWLGKKNYNGVEQIDFFLLNSACAWFPWNRKVA